MSLFSSKVSNEGDPLISGVDDDETAAAIATTDNNRSSSSSARGPSFLGVLCTLLMFIIVAAAIVLIVANPVFTVPPGTISIVVTWGTVTAYGPGVHYKIPFVSQVIQFSSQTQKLEEENSIPTKEGLNVKLDTAVLFRLDTDQAANLYQSVGEDYIDLLLMPEVSSAIRGMTSESDAKALYSSGRTTIQNALKDELTQKLEPRGIIIEDVLLKDVELPEELTKAIELKAKAEQDAATMEFVLQKEKQEAERKAIEAKGIADFQRIVSEGISAELLQWKGVEATEKFADSMNSKIIIMGNDGGGLPVILSAASDKE